MSMNPASTLLRALAVSAPARAANKIRAALTESGSVVGAAKALGVSRSLLSRLMSELGVSLERVVR